MSRIVRFASIASLVTALCLFAACGSGLPHSNQVNARITPETASVAAAGSIVLHAETSGFTDPNLLFQWGVAEANYAQGDHCGYVGPPPAFPCECGYVIYSVSKNSATYYAMSPGTYHVTLEATQYARFDWVTAKATATITVTQ